MSAVTSLGDKHIYTWINIYFLLRTSQEIMPVGDIGGILPKNHEIFFQNKIAQIYDGRSIFTDICAGFRMYTGCHNIVWWHNIGRFFKSIWVFDSNFSFSKHVCTVCKSSFICEILEG